MRLHKPTLRAQDWKLEHSSPDRLIFNLGPDPDPVPDLDRVRTFGTGTL